MICFGIKVNLRPINVYCFSSFHYNYHVSCFIIFIYISKYIGFVEYTCYS